MLCPYVCEQKLFGMASGRCYRVFLDVTAVYLCKILIYRIIGLFLRFFLFELVQSGPHNCSLVLLEPLLTGHRRIVLERILVGVVEV